MKWKFSSKKEGSGNSRKETLQNYEQKYLEKFDKVKNEIQKMNCLLYTSPSPRD